MCRPESPGRHRYAALRLSEIATRGAECGEIFMLANAELVQPASSDSEKSCNRTPASEQRSACHASSVFTDR
jgi:hypothetical protein